MHRLEPRLCRWLLQTVRASGERIELTQEMLAQLLGVTRARLNEALKRLEISGALAQPSRGIIHVLNHAMIQTTACDCSAALGLVPSL